MLRRGSAQLLLPSFQRARRHATLFAAGLTVMVVAGALGIAARPGLIVRSASPQLGQSAILLDQAESEAPLGVEPAVDFSQTPLPERRPTLTGARGSDPCFPQVAVGDRITLGVDGANREFQVTQFGIGAAETRKPGRRTARGVASIECWFNDPATGARVRALIEAKPLAPTERVRNWQQKL